MMNKKEPNPLAFVASSERVNREVAPGAATRLYVDTEGVKKVNTAASHMNITSSSRERVGGVVAASVVAPPILQPVTAESRSIIAEEAGLGYAAADEQTYYSYSPVAEAEAIFAQQQPSRPDAPQQRSSFETLDEATIHDPVVPRVVRDVEDLRTDMMAQDMAEGARNRINDLFDHRAGV